MRWELEELAREALERANVSSPVDPEIVADRHKLVVRHAATDGLLIGRTIYVREEHRRQRRAFAIAHEIAHWLLRRAGIPDTEANANYLASALLLPRLEFEAALRRYGWDLIMLCALHPFASFEAVTRRIVALREARAVVFDKPLRGQRRPSCYTVPYGLVPTDEERMAAREAVRSGAPVELRAGLTGWPVLEWDWHRAITLAAL